MSKAQSSRSGRRPSCKVAARKEGFSSVFVARKILDASHGLRLKVAYAMLQRAMRENVDEAEMMLIRQHVAAAVGFHLSRLELQDHSRVVELACKMVVAAEARFRRQLATKSPQPEACAAA